MARIHITTAVFAWVVSLSGCATDSVEPTDDLEAESIPDEEVFEDAAPRAADIYTPFTGSSTIGSALTYGWHGHATTYPAGMEDMRGYALPSTIECSNNKSLRSHLDVTSGCLKAVAIGSYSRGQIEESSSGAFRVVALPFAGSEANPMKWSDQKNEFRFYYAATTGVGTDPGVKAFVRYHDEYNLYVASWRMDGKVNIKRKVNGTYKTLAEVSMPKPSPNAWHKIQFHATGSKLELYLDGARVLSATDTSFAWGTSGIRTDAMNGAYLDEWTIK